MISQWNFTSRNILLNNFKEDLWIDNQDERESDLPTKEEKKIKLKAEVKVLTNPKIKWEKTSQMVWMVTRTATFVTHFLQIQSYHHQQQNKKIK